MLTQFKSMNELVEYLGTLEERIRKLEVENRLLREVPPTKETVNSNPFASSILEMFPQTNLLSFSFVKRAFSMWGHFFVANLIIGTVLAILYFCFVAAMFGSLLENVM